VAGPDCAAGWDGVTVPELALESPDEDEPPDAEVPPVESGEEDDEDDDGALVDEPVVSVVGVVVVDVEEVLDVLVVAGALATTAVAVGTVNGGTSAVSGEAEPPPQAATPTASAEPAISAAKDLDVRERLGAFMWRKDDQSRGSMRLPQCGQSLRSRWLCWSHQLQKRRFSTDQGSSDGVGASGSSSPTTSSSSPVSRSR
jgi:hypothetical protein